MEKRGAAAERSPAGQGSGGQGPAGQGPAGQGPAGQGPAGQRTAARACRLVRGGIVGVLLLIAVAGCRTAPDPAEIPRLDGAPESGSDITTDDIRLTIDSRAVDPQRVDHVRIEVYPSDSDAAAPIATYRVTPALPALSFNLPFRGLEDQREYRFAFFLVLDDDSEHRLLEDLVLRLRFGVGTPEIDDSPLRTFDPRPELSWSAPMDTVAAGVVAEISAAGGEPTRFEGAAPEQRGTVRPEADVVNAADIAAGTERTWRVRLVNAAGVQGPWSEAGRIVFTDTIDPPGAITGHSGMPSVVPEPGLVWRALAGARRYQVEVGVPRSAAERADGAGPPAPPDPPSATRLSLEALEARLRLGTTQIADLFGGPDGGPDGAADRGVGLPIAWRVRGENGLGNRTGWSEWFQFAYRPLIPTMQTVLSPQVASSAVHAVVLGADARETNEADEDETPPVTVAVPIPYEMTRFEVTAEAVAAVFTAAIAGGRAVIATDENDNRFVIDPETGLPLLGVDALDFGRQFTITLDDTELAPAPGYRSHPAVGVSWYGAVALANELSLLAARDAVYEFGPTGVTAHPERDGYRLPTEAEWAFAAALREPLRPISPSEGDAAGLTDSNAQLQRVAENRPLSAVDMRGINYQRSGDRWEDVNPPFTRAGGPTAPVGAAGDMNGIGIADLLGNVWEWTADWYDPQWYARAATVDRPADELFRGPDEPVLDVYGRELKVLRGSAWNTPENAVRRTSRGTFSPASTSYSIGVRLVRSIVRTPAPASRNN